MLQNYFKIALRSLIKFKGYAIINLTGLALGLTAGILIMVYVLDEMSYDKFHRKRDRIYRVETAFFTPETKVPAPMETNGWGVGTALKSFPETESVLYTRSASFLLVNHEGKRIRQQMHFATPEFLEIFSFDLLRGNPAKALNEPYSIVITEDMAKKYFPDGDALNRSLLVADTLQLVVTGVMKNIPSNSHVQLDAVISFSTYTAINTGFDFNDGWGNINVRNYILLREGADFEAFSKKARNIYMDRVAGYMKSIGVEAYVYFNPLTKLYLHSKNGNGMGPIGSIQRLYLVSGIASFVILLACINFINLTTARSVYRAKEVGLRKVAGSTRYALIRQFLSESFILTVISLLFAVTFAGLIMPLFNGLLNKSYTLRAMLEIEVITGIAILVLMITFLSGYYPSMVMSALKPAEVLKGKMQTGSRGVRLRRALVVFQFVISAALVLGTLVVIDQLKFMQKQDLGFAKDEILVINAARANSPNPNAHETFKNELRSIASVEQISFTNSLPGNPGWQGQVSYAEGRSPDEAISVEYMAIDEDYIPTLGLQIIAGENFSTDKKADIEDGLVLNETATAMYGFASPEEAIGKRIESPSGYPAGKIIGIVKDYHQLGLQQKIGPMAMDYNPGSSYMYAIRYKAANTQELIAEAGKKWTSLFPGYDFNYFFLDQDFEKQYQSEERLAKVFGFFSGLTIVIAVIGLLGLVSFMVVARTKEIGVRKVLGADVFNITRLLSMEFLALIALANVIAFPLVWYFVNEWLLSFATHTTVDPVLFVMTLVISITIALVTISFQTIRAAMTNPVDALRYE